MAKTKTELFKEAQRAGLVGEGASADNFTADQLSAMLDPTEPAGGGVAPIEGSLSDAGFMEAPDGHRVK